MAIKRRDNVYVYHKVGDHQTIFEISDEDLSGDPQYFGYVNEDGSWIIQERNVAGGTYRYAIGIDNYHTPITGTWATRAALTYVAFDSL